MTNSSTSIIKELKRREERTPDFNLFKRDSFCLLFVYDEMKRGGELSFYLKDDIYLGEAKTHTDMYCLRNFEDEYPIVLDETDKVAYKRGFIKGEIYAVRPEKILYLDAFRDNRGMCLRTRRSFLLEEQQSPFKTDSRVFNQAWIYIGNPEWWKNFQLQYEAGYLTPLANGSGRRNRYYEYKVKGHRPSNSDSDPNEDGMFKFGNWNEHMY